MPLVEGVHADLLRDAIAAEARGQRALLAGEPAAGALHEAAALYRASWEAAPPRSFGRLIGMLKAAVLAGDAADAARYARGALGGAPDSPPAAYALAIAALVEGEDATAADALAAMRDGSPAMIRAADAIAALLAHDAVAYAEAIRAIVADFEQRQEHLTGVPIADTALMLERLAGRRGLACGAISAMLPQDDR
jgi:hypothetical protein